MHNKIHFLEAVLRRFSQINASHTLVRGSIITSQLVKPHYRPANDIDLLMEGAYDPQNADALIYALHDTEVNDHFFLHREQLEQESIWLENPFPGRRYQIGVAYQTQTEKIQIDIAFGDTLCTAPQVMPYQDQQDSLINLPTPSIEQMLAWKTHGLFEFWHINTRWQMKDLYDIYLLLLTQKIDNTLFERALRLAFEDKETPFSVYEKVRNEEFGRSKNSQKHWQKFVEKMNGNVIVESHLLLIPPIRNFLNTFFDKL